MDLTSPSRVDIGMFVHPVMLRREAFELAFAADYEQEKKRILSKINLYASDFEALKYHAEHVVNLRLRQLTSQQHFDTKVVALYMWIQSHPGPLLKDIYVDVHIVANSPCEKRQSIENFLAHKYGGFMESLDETNSMAYRL